MSPAERLLAQLEAQLAEAREALADEAEGRLRRAALLLWKDSSELYELVTTW